MWPSPILNGLPYHPFMASPIGFTFPGLFRPWHQFNRPNDSQQPMFWPQLKLSTSSDEPQQNGQTFTGIPSTGISNYNQNMLHLQPYNIGLGTTPFIYRSPSNIPTTSVQFSSDDESVQQDTSCPAQSLLDADVAKANEAMALRDEIYRRRHSKQSPFSYRSPQEKLTSIRRKSNQFEGNRNLSPSQRVHSPPVLGIPFTIPSPNAASTPLKPLEPKQILDPRPDTVEDRTNKLSAVVKIEPEFEVQPLDLRVRKRIAEDTITEYERDAKKTKVQSLNDVGPPVTHFTPTSQTNIDVKLNSYNEIIDSVNDLSASKLGVECFGAHKNASGKFATKIDQTQTTSIPSNVSSLYLSSGYDSGVVADAGHDSTNVYEQNVLLLKSGVYVLFCCQHCEYKTVEKLEANGHMVEHCDHVVKQRCTLCEKDFSFSEDIRHHILQSHQPYDSREFKCSQPNCDGAYSQEKLLNFHLRQVHGDKSYKCLQIGCGKSFSTGSALKHHQFIHTDIFKCSWVGCGKRFRDDFNLRTHFMIHTGKKPRQCSQCDYSCIQKNSMDWHMKTKHKC